MKRVIELTEKDERQLELDLRNKHKEVRRNMKKGQKLSKEWDKWTTELIRLTSKLKATPINQLFDYRPIQKVLDKLKVLEAEEQRIYNPHGNYDGYETYEDHFSKDPEGQRLMEKQDEWTGPVPCGKATKEEIQAYEKDLRRRTKEEAEEERFDRELKNKAESDAIEAEKFHNEMEREKMNKMFTLTGPHPLSDKIKKAMKELQRDDEFMDILGNIVDILSNAKNTNKSKRPDTYPEGQERYVYEPECIQDKDYYNKALSANPHNWPITLPKRFSEDIPKKEKPYKAITLFCKVIVGSILIFYGLIILEIIFATRPISTYLNKVLGLM